MFSTINMSHAPIMASQMSNYRYNLPNHLVSFQDHKAGMHHMQKKLNGRLYSTLGGPIQMQALNMENGPHVDPFSP